jgi:hypothetical protein
VYFGSIHMRVIVRGLFSFLNYDYGNTLQYSYPNKTLCGISSPCRLLPFHQHGYLIFLRICLLEIINRLELL